MAGTPEGDVNDSVDDTNAGNVATDAEVKTPNKPSDSEAEAPQELSNLKNRRKVHVLAGIVVLILIIIGGIIFYKVSNYLWEAKQRRIAEKKCKEYTKFACDHPLPSNSSQILLGEIAVLGMYPHMAFVAVIDDQGREFDCGGSLISENFILSAAHCVTTFRNVKTTVSLGVVNLNYRKPYKVKNVYVHPLSDVSPDPYDVLLLELDQKVEFTSYVRPICLNTEYSGKYDRIIATGWGLKEDGHLALDLRTADLVIDGVVAEKCDNELRPELGDKFTKFVCAGWPNSSRSVNKGDSGGPLQVLSDSRCANMYVQIGIAAVVQTRPYTANLTLLSLHVKVANVVPWIASIVWPNESA